MVVISILNGDIALLQGIFEKMLYLQVATFRWVVVFSFIEFHPCSRSNNLRLKMTFCWSTILGKLFIIIISRQTDSQKLISTVIKYPGLWKHTLPQCRSY